jgi:hypothetical protein
LDLLHAVILQKQLGLLLPFELPAESHLWRLCQKGFGFLFDKKWIQPLGMVFF